MLVIMTDDVRASAIETTIRDMLQSGTIRDDERVSTIVMLDTLSDRELAVAMCDARLSVQ